MVLSKNLDENIAKLDALLGIGKAFDVQSRAFKVLNKRVQMYYIDGLVDNLEIISVMEQILHLPEDKDYDDFFEIHYNNIPHKGAEVLENIDEIYEIILTGVLLFLVEDSDKALSIETRGYPVRSIDEPDLEKVIRGSHEGFTEALSLNIGLLRRKIHDGKLRNEIFKIGNKSKYDVCLSYIEGECDPDLLEDVRNKLKNVKIDHLIMTDKALEELIAYQRFNPYPLVRYTERPDVVGVHLYQGKFAIFVDTSPSVILAPATFFDHLQHTEEFRQSPLSGTYIRLLRIIGVFLSTFLTPIWLLVVMYDINVPEIFSIFAPDDAIKISIFLQIIAAEIGVEFLRMASIHTPSSLSTAMGLVAGILLGDIAIQIGVFSIQTVFLVAISAIGGYLTPSYELSLANKLSKLLFLVVIFIFGIIGFAIIFFMWLIFLISLKSFNTRYMYSLFPFNWKDLKNTLIRKPTKENDNAETKL